MNKYLNPRTHPGHAPPSGRRAGNPRLGQCRGRGNRVETDDFLPGRAGFLTAARHSGWPTGKPPPLYTFWPKLYTSRGAGFLLDLSEQLSRNPIIFDDLRHQQCGIRAGNLAIRTEKSVKLKWNLS